MKKTTNNHTKTLFNLALPVMITQMGHIVTGIVDTVFLGKISSTHQAAGILANNLYTLVLVFAIGVSYASTPLVTGANQNNDLTKKAALFKNSLWLNFAIAIISFIVLYFASGLLSHMQQPAEVVELSIPFYNVLIFSMLPVSIFFSCKQYCEGLSLTLPALYISVIGNLINVGLNYALINGIWFFPQLGYMGSAWASFCARLFMGVGFFVYIFISPKTNEIKAIYKKIKVSFEELKPLIKIGLNSGAQFTFEVAAFVVAGLMAGVFGKEQIDSHGIALHLAAFTYMFGSGMASATTIQVGNYFANNNWPEIKNVVKSSLKIIFIGMGICGLIFICFNNLLPTCFSKEKSIIDLTSKLLLIAAMFQLFDGTQVMLIGALRGVEDVKYPTIITLVSYWVICLPLAYLFAFKFNLQVVGIWYALLISLIVVALGLYLRLRRLFNINIKT